MPNYLESLNDALDNGIAVGLEKVLSNVSNIAISP